MDVTSCFGGDISKEWINLMVGEPLRDDRCNQFVDELYLEISHQLV